MPMDDRHEAETAPERTCAGCRQQDARDALLRLVVDPDGPRLVPDPRRRLPGRGVSVHPTPECLRRAVERGGFARSLRMKIATDWAGLCAVVAAQYERRLEGLLLAARRNQSLVMGTEAVRRTLTEQPVPLLLVTRDAASRREELAEQAVRLGGRCVVYGTKSELGRLMGRAELGVMAILDAGIAGEVVAVAARATELAGPGSARSAVSEAE